MNSKKGKKPVGTAKKPKPEALMGDLFAAAFKRNKCAAAATIAAVLVLAALPRERRYFIFSMSVRGMQPRS